MLEIRSVPPGCGAFDVADPPPPAAYPARIRLLRRLDEAINCAQLVLVTGPAGAGKSTLVQSWVDRRSQGTPTTPASDRIAVLEDFPVLVDGGEALDDLVRATTAGRRAVVVCTGYPALDLRRSGVRLPHRTVGGHDLVMNDLEIATALDLRGLEPTPRLVGAVARRTAGWSSGVDLAATLLTEQDEADALREVEHCIADYLEDTVLADLSDDVRDLLVATSLADDVTPELMATVVGRDRRLSPSTAASLLGFVRRRGDGSFTVHPLLRRHLRQHLRQSRASTVIAHRVAAFELAHGRLEHAVAIAVDAADWRWAASTLIESFHVTRFLSSTTCELLSRPQVAEALGSVEPVLMAATALGRSWPDLARRAVDSLGRGPDRSRSSTVPRRLSETLVRMALARWEADGVTGLVQVRRAVDLMSQLSVSQRAALPELRPLVQSHLASFELSEGTPSQARAALESGAWVFRSRPATEISPQTQAAAADCLGMLAWQEAIAGELNRALHHAGEVLTSRTADSGEIGVVHAQLATVWCHIERSELDQAVQRLDTVSERRTATTDAAVLPELDGLILLTATRLESALGQHPIPPSVDTSPELPHRLADQLLLLQARTCLDAGEVEPALVLLDRLADPSTVGQVLRARAAVQLGDVAAVAEALRARPVTQVSLDTQIQVELLEAWLARSHHEQERKRCLLDRALRSAAREGLRTQIAWAKPWLHDAIAADPALLQRHGAFLATVRMIHPAPAAAAGSAASTVAAPLTQRELDILQRLGSLSTNEEIATELYLSTNTVKTHLKSLYRKLDVTRRSDAFRRGRRLGLC